MTRHVVVGHGNGQRDVGENVAVGRGVALREGNPADIPARCYFEGSELECGGSLGSLVCGLWPTPRGEA